MEELLVLFVRHDGAPAAFTEPEKAMVRDSMARRQSADSESTVQSRD